MAKRPLAGFSSRFDNGPAVLQVERIERTLILAAELVVEYGPQYAPWVDRLENELEAAKRSDPVAKAQRILDEHAMKRGAPI